jgi:hypothetical protein
MMSKMDIRSTFVKSKTNIKQVLIEKNVTYYGFVLDLSCKEFADLLTKVLIVLYLSY